MKKFIAQRLAYSLISLFLLTLTIFLFVRLTGDPTVLLVEPGASREDMAMVRQQLGLDRSLWVQYVSFAAHMRITRSSMLDVLGSEYVKLARLKGLPERRVIVKHALKNALIPVLTLAGINVVLMVNTAIVVETVFAWPGIGRLLYEGIAFRDFPVVQAVV